MYVRASRLYVRQKVYVLATKTMPSGLFNTPVVISAERLTLDIPF